LVSAGRAEKLIAASAAAAAATLTMLSSASASSATEPAFRHGGGLAPRG